MTNEQLKFFQELSDKDFAETFFTIVDKDRREIPLKSNVVQSELERAWSQFNVVLKYRKPGVSLWVQLVKILGRCLRFKNLNCAVLSFDKESTQMMLDRTYWTLAHLPKPFAIHLDRDSKNEFKIRETNSKMFIGSPGTKSFGRGSDLDIVHISEHAFWEDTGVITGVMEALTNDPFVVVESTANGPMNDFAKLYRKAAAGGSPWKAFFFPWWIDPMLERDLPLHFAHTEEEKDLLVKYPKMTDRKLAWRRWKISTMERAELFPQEYPASAEEAFIVMGDCVFNLKALANYDKLVRYPMQVGYLTQSGAASV